MKLVADDVVLRGAKSVSILVFGKLKERLPSDWLQRGAIGEDHCECAERHFGVLVLVKIKVRHGLGHSKGLRPNAWKEVTARRGG